MTVVNYYSAAWCGPCKVARPVVEQVVRENPSVQYRYIDVDHSPQDAQANGVRSVPTVIVKRDGVEVARYVGAQPKSVYESAIK